MEKGNKRIINAWVFYDWANSSYPLVITTAIFPIYYGAVMQTNGENVVTAFGREWNNATLLSWTLAIAFFLVSAISPVLSGVADYLGNKKFFMKFFCYLGALSCASLYFFNQETLPWSLLSIILASVGFWGSLVFYNSYLPEIAEPKDHDKISARGFSMGYIGSVLLLIANLVFVMKPELIFSQIPDLIAAAAAQSPEPNLDAISKEIRGPFQLQIMKWAFVTVAIWWIGFAQITFRVLPEEVNKHKVTAAILFNGFRELLKVFKEFMQIPRLKIFLLSYFIYSMAVQTLLQMAVIFADQEILEIVDGQEVHMDKGKLILILLIIQLVAIVGAFVLSRLSGKIGNIKTLGVTLVVWIIACLIAYQVKYINAFYMLALVVGFVMGGIQSLSRSTYSKLLPETQDHASYFSFFDVLEKLAIVIGLIGFGYVVDIFGEMRNTTFIMAILFLLGLIVLFFMPKNKAMEVLEGKD